MRSSVFAFRSGQVWHVIFGALSILSSITLTLVLAEFGLRVLLPAPSVYRVMPPNLEMTFNAERYAKGVRGPALFKVNSMGVRGREWSTDRASEYRILALGGSTTESLLNDQSRIWTALLEQKLGQLADGRHTWVGNMGKAGLASTHHNVQLKHLDVYDPNLIVVLVGSSDFMSFLKRSADENPNSADSIEDERTLEEQAFSVFPGRSLGEQPSTWYRGTRLWHLGSVFTKRVFGRSERQDPEGLSLKQWRAMRASGKRSTVMPPLEAALDSYERELKKMVRLAHNFGALILLMTQPSIWRADLTDAEKGQLWMGGVGEFRDVPGSTYYEPEVLERGMDAFNQRLLKVCRESGTPYVDLAKAVPKSTDFFYDDEHFTDRGHEIVAINVAEAIAPLLPNSSRDQGLLPAGAARTFEYRY
ncbi:MAG: SGNH/GDSL hydrolase family protein [Nitrososphaera sp.]|nr:SGNH/GDSL hydrolase family protein [Nitrososphaera sp.]